jgi:hypothetical protein
MNEIPRRSFLALLGAAVVAAKLPTIPAAAPPPVQVASKPLTVLRRWWITGIERRGDRGFVRLGETFVPEDFAAAVPMPMIVNFKDIASCSMDRPVLYHQTLEGGPIVETLPATAEIEVSFAVALDIQKGMMNGRDFIEFAGDGPI